MKFVCRNCESWMHFQDVEAPGEDALGITFGCESCGARFSMVTNAGETQMVKSLGVSLGGREAPASAFELTQSMQGEDCPAQAAAPTPTAAHVAHAAGAEGAAAVASSSVGKCPFANKMAVATAKEAGPSPTGSVSWTEGASRRLLNVPEEIRPIAKQLIEGMARDRGTGLVDDTMMDLARDTFM